MTDTITRQVSDYVKMAMEAANSARLLLHFNYISTHGGEPSHRPEQVPSSRYTEREQEVSLSNRSNWPYTEQLGRLAAARPNGNPTQGATALHYPHDPPPQKPQPYCLIPCTLTLARRRNKFHLLGVTAFVLGLLALVYVVEVGLEITILLKFLSQRNQNFMQIPHGIGTALLIAVLLGLSHLFSARSRFSLGLCERLFYALSLYSRPLGCPDQPSAFPSTAGTGLLAPLPFGTPQRLSPPERMPRPLSPPPRENLAAGSALMKLVDGRWGARRRTGDSLRSSSNGLRGAACSWRPGMRSPVERLSYC
ncbi:LOW QUALITY PROTEIN: hypothetical protein Cgig2_017136 [Carnegiea gigantea]|uniref:Uncharacterized protein n=1 Tax=Carnegiea gigantea TaxID=171969 RepID=A0A9Q1Q3R8_9CARY|nr:LOW QUALITY PROTEIN: hypothetical protein Cgig2_017136 [Carnegiea gigantea]